MYELKVTGSFAAAHRLSNVTEKCENLHGHNWRTELYIKSDKLNEFGVVIDFGIIKNYLREILGYLDHKYLNELEPFKNINASSEVLAKFISDEIEKRIENKDISVSRVTVWESDNAAATYYPEK
ncbi:MAG: 6-carboxytetrahydropterin synthase QueD [Desulforegulaceae bacterium]|nr:6-carboxytetrahydropterin synthase QueD [Desulforegulaceae bacterium]